MRRRLSILLLCLPLSAPAALSVQKDSIDISQLRQAPPSAGLTQLNSRSFTANLYSAQVADAVYFNRSSHVLVVCKAQAAEACRSFAIAEAVEVVPLQEPLSKTSLLIFGTANTSSVCTLNDTDGLKCNDFSLKSASGNAQLFPNGKNGCPFSKGQS